MDNCEKEVFERITAVESSLKSLHKRVDHIEELVESVQRMTVEIQHLREDLNSYAGKVEAIEEKPAKRWDSIVAAAISALTGGILGMILTKLIGG